MGDPCFVALFPLEDLSSQVVSEADVWLASSQSLMLPGWTRLGEGVLQARAGGAAGSGAGPGFVGQGRGGSGVCLIRFEFEWRLNCPLDFFNRLRWV